VQASAVDRAPFGAVASPRGREEGAEAPVGQTAPGACRVVRPDMQVAPSFVGRIPCGERASDSAAPRLPRLPRAWRKLASGPARIKWEMREKNVVCFSVGPRQKVISGGSARWGPDAMSGGEMIHVKISGFVI